MGTDTQKGAIPNTLEALFHYIKQKRNADVKMNKKTDLDRRPTKAIRKSVC